MPEPTPPDKPITKTTADIIDGVRIVEKIIPDPATVAENERLKTENADLKLKIPAPNPTPENKKNDFDILEPLAGWGEYITGQSK